MHPVTQRWLLIQELDNYAMILCLAYFVFLILGDVLIKKWKWAGVSCRVIGYLSVIAVFAYFIWRTFYAWKGIYY